MSRAEQERPPLHYSFPIRPRNATDARVPQSVDVSPSGYLIYVGGSGTFAYDAVTGRDTFVDASARSGGVGDHG